MGWQDAPAVQAAPAWASAPAVQSQPPSMSMGDMASGAVQNFPSSALNLGKNIIAPVMHPIETATNLYHLGAGIIEKATGMGGADEATANSVGQYFADRYGGIENVKRTIATDPAGFMADASVVLGGGGAAAKLGGLSKVAEGAQIVNPISLGLKGAGAAANLTGKGLAEALGVTTGAGGQSIKAAYGAGLQGGDAAAAFTNNLRGNVPMQGVVSDARDALRQLRENRSDEYLAGMGGVNSDPTVLSLSPVDAAVAKVSSVRNFKGVDTSESTAAVRQQIADKLAEWKALNPADYHTPAGFDALKQSIGDIKDSTPYGTPSRVVANQAYNAVRNAVAAQAPEYNATMQAYGDASDNISDIEKTLSLGPNASTDTSIRKLQSALRDNVNTTYGRRTDLANELAANGAPNLIESIAGQTLSSPTTRGIGKLMVAGELPGMATAVGL